jgi:hypothetical protein
MDGPRGGGNGERRWVEVRGSPRGPANLHEVGRADAGFKEPTTVLLRRQLAGSLLHGEATTNTQEHSLPACRPAQRGPGLVEVCGLFLKTQWRTFEGVPCGVV